MATCYKLNSSDINILFIFSFLLLQKLDIGVKFFLATKWKISKTTISLYFWMILATKTNGWDIQITTQGELGVHLFLPTRFLEAILTAN